MNSIGKQRQVDAIRSLEKQSCWAADFDQACTEIWRAMEDPDSVLGNNNGVVAAVAPVAPIAPHVAIPAAPVQAGLLQKRVDTSQQKQQQQQQI